MSSLFSGTGPGSIYDKMENLSPENFEDFFNSFSQSDIDSLMKGFIVPYLFTMAALFLISVFIMLPLTVGVTRWYVRAREASRVKTSLCFSPFKKGSYFQTVWSMFYYEFWLSVFFFLFFVPGLVKSYSYRMIPYILADNPNIGARRALKLSKAMTRGHKIDMFILDLSFIGWILVGLAACCIGTYAVVPYIYATYAELYDVLKKDAASNGLCTMEELGYIPTATAAGTTTDEPVPAVIEL
jgi:uncharacterized membrane protein